MEKYPSQPDGTATPITDLEQQNQKRAIQIIELKKAIKEKQKIIDLQDEIDAQNRETITVLEEQNQNKEQQIIRLEKTVKKKQKIIDGHANTVTEKEKAILELKTKKETKAREIEQVKSEAQEKIAELKETTSKLLDPRMVVTVNAVREKIDDFDPQNDKTLLINWLSYYRNEWLADGVEIELGDLNKIYVQEHLSIRSLPADLFPMLIERLCPNSFDWLYLSDLAISFVDYKNLVAISKIVIFEIDQVTVTNEGGTVVSVDQLLKELPDFPSFEYTFKDGEAMDGLAEKFVQLPKFTKLNNVILRNIQEGFDLKTFGQFIKKNDHVQWILYLNVCKETFAEMERVQKEIASNLPSTCFFSIGKYAEFLSLKKDAEESENEYAELKETNSKFIDPHDFLTVLEYKKAKFNKFQNKTLLTFRLAYVWNKWKADDKTRVFLDDSNFKIFVQDSMCLYSLPAATFTSLIERLQSNSFRELYLTDLTMSFVEYKNLVRKGNICKLGIHRVTVMNKNGTASTVDHLLKEVPNIHFFNYSFNDGESVNGIAQKLVKLPKFPKLHTFQLVNIPEDFDSEVFGQFIKKNAIKDGQCSLRFTTEIIFESSSSRPFFMDRSQMFLY